MMKSFSTSLLCCASLLPVLGCRQANAEKKEQGAEAPLLTAEAARSALIEMVTRDHPNDPGWQLAVLQNAPFKKDEDSTLVAGTWRCNPSGRWFHLDIGTPTDPFWWSYHGEFEVGPDGKWHAKITKRVHGHSEPKQ